MSSAAASAERPIIVWSAGEASGDHHAAQVIEILRRERPDIEHTGLGGPAMAGVGADLVASMQEVSVVGFTEVVSRLPRIWTVWRRLSKLIVRRRAALFVPVDFPGFNLRFARVAHRRGVPVVYFISPQVWAWGAGRLPKMRDLVRRMLVVLPFEVPIYEEAKIPVTFVGHPLVEQVARVPDRAASRAALGIDAGATVVVLMPGSRPSEVSRLLDPMLAAARELGRTRDLTVVVRQAPGIERSMIERAALHAAATVRIAEGGDARAVRAADLAIVASGTATLETALLGTPMLITYKVSALTFAIASRLVSIHSIGLVNVVYGERLVPELLQKEVTVGAIVEHATRLLDDGAARRAQLDGLARVARSLGDSGSAEKTARAILGELEVGQS